MILNPFRKPTNDQNWSTDQAILPYAEINQNILTVRNIRNFSYKTTTDYTPNYYDKTFDINQIKKVWYMLEPFAGFRGAAHTFLTFEFEENNFLAISMEIRKKKGESFSAIKGMINQYELVYVVADERDVIKLRSNFRKDLVYLYPLKSSKEKIGKLFIHMLQKANHLKEHPEFYNSVFNNCTGNIVDHINEISPKTIPRWSIHHVLPEKSDTYLYDLGLIDTELPFEQARKKYLINERAEKYADDPDFSVRIRQD